MQRELEESSQSSINISDVEIARVRELIVTNLTS